MMRRGGKTRFLTKTSLSSDIPSHLFFFLFVLQIIVFLILVRMTLPTTIDDTFITLRYAYHTSEGYFSQWNLHAPPQEGYTHPLFFLIASLLFLLTQHPLLSLKLISIIMFLFSLFSLPTLFRSLSLSSPRLATLVALPPLLYTPITLIHASSGLETLFYTGLLLLTTSIALTLLQNEMRSPIQSFPSLFLLLILLSLTRPEGMLVSLVILFFFAFKQKRFIPLILYAVFLIIFEMIRFIIFHLPLPLPAYVKALSGGSFIFNVLVSIFQSGIFLLFLLPPLIYLFSEKKKIAPNEPLILAFLIILAQIGIYIFSNRMMDFAFRFFYPAIILIIILSTAYFVGLISSYRKRVFLSTFFSLAAVLLFWTVRAGEFFSYTPLAFTLFNAHGMLGAALFNISTYTPITVMGGDAGIVPYVGGDNVTFIDSIGLNTPFFARSTHSFNNTLGFLMEQTRPDIIILVSRDRYIFSPSGYSDLYVYNHLRRNRYSPCNATFPLNAKGDGTYILFTYTRNSSFCQVLRLYSEVSWDRYKRRYPAEYPLPALRGKDMYETIQRLFSLSPFFYTPSISYFSPEDLRSHALDDS